jgi:hypothetical protein
LANLHHANTPDDYLGAGIFGWGFHVLVFKFSAAEVVLLMATSTDTLTLLGMRKSAH